MDFPKNRRVLTYFLGAAMGIVLLSLSLSCGSNKSVVETQTPLSIQEELETAAAVLSEEGTLVLRYNPCICACPAFELQIDQRWVRAGLEGEDEPDSPAAKLVIQARTDHLNGDLAHYQVRGDVKSKLQPCDKGAIYLLVSVESDE
jgi:hypothetical protein